VARVAAALDGRPALLVLDNCEHLVADAARLTERLLAAAPGLRILATSREALGINGEALCPVAPLELPPPGTDAERALASPAVRLFTERAGAVCPGFDPAADPVSVVRLCTALDGLPLAIELAAARLRSMSVADIAARLGAPPDVTSAYGLGVRPDALFRLLSRGSRTAQPRQRTLRAVVDWSWDLLPEDERAVLRRASVFAGGWTLEAAEAVCADPPGGTRSARVAPDDVLDLVAALVEKSLLVAWRPDSSGRVRYRMLESIRAYGAERLDEAGESEAARRAHLTYFLDFALTADPRLRGSGQLAWLRLLSDDRDNFQAALHRALDAGDVPMAMRLIAALSSYWLLRGLRYEGAGAARRVLAATGPRPPEGMEEEYALCVMAVVGTLPDTREYAAHVAAATELMEARNRLAHRYPALTLLWAPFAGVPRDASAVASAVDRFLAESGDPWYRALLRLGMGFQAWMVGADVETARREGEAAFEGFRGHGDRWGMITCLGFLADLADYLGDFRQAVALLGRAEALARELDSALDMAELLCNRAAYSLRAGDHAAAAGFSERAAEFSRRAGAPETLAMARLGLAEAARLRGDLAAARDLCERALAECPVGWFSSNGTRVSVLLGLARIALAEGDPAAARARFGEACGVERLAVQFPLTGATAAVDAAGLALLEGEPRAAAALLGAARALRGRSLSGPDAQAAEAGARTALGDEAYEAALAATSSLSRDAAVDVVERYLAPA
jgi:predicted ATPase